MTALPWLYLGLLSLGYGLALSFGQLGWLALISIALLVFAGSAVRQQTVPVGRFLGHGLFIVLALALAMHWLPGFYNGRAIPAHRFTDNAVPFSMVVNLDKPLIGFWLLLACPWIVARRSLRLTVYATALALTLSVILALGGAVLLGMITWAPKWPDQAWLWVLNNLLLVTLVEEALFRGYIQGGLSRHFKHLPYGENLALLLASLLFGLVHVGAGWQWVLLAGLAGVGYGLAYRFGGLSAAILTHFGLNLLHFGPVHLSDACGLKQAPFCDAVLINEKKLQQIADPADNPSKPCGLEITMRNNQPITQRERTFPAQQRLISTTDAQRRDHLLQRRFRRNQRVFA